MNYALIDSGNQKKWERFGPLTIVRPCIQALWKPKKKQWASDASFSRERSDAVERGHWEGSLPVEWEAEHQGIRFCLRPTDFGHLGIFPEHSALWKWSVSQGVMGKAILNVFAHSGGTTMALAKEGASVCHVDASPKAIVWAKENALLNGLTSAPIRWIVDDACKFLKREIRRGRKYDGILLDPPSFGRGPKGEVFKIERDLPLLLSLCRNLLSESPLFFICSCHTNSLTPTVMSHLLDEVMEGNVESGELFLGEDHSLSGQDVDGEKVRLIPTGAYGRWTP